jgi:hypothetical protein
MKMTSFTRKEVGQFDLRCNILHIGGVMERHRKKFSSKMKYRLMTDFIYLMCKLSIIGKKRVAVHNREFDHVHDAMYYILGLGFPSNKISTPTVASKDSE